MSNPGVVTTLQPIQYAPKMARWVPVGETISGEDACAAVIDAAQGVDAINCGGWWGPWRGIVNTGEAVYLSDWHPEVWRYRHVVNVASADIHDWETRIAQA
jgi:hypothetical protein